MKFHYYVAKDHNKRVRVSLGRESLYRISIVEMGEKVQRKIGVTPKMEVDLGVAQA